jgi:RHS repeat-associated protein
MMVWCLLGICLRPSSWPPPSVSASSLWAFTVLHFIIVSGQRIVDQRWQYDGKHMVMMQFAVCAFDVRFPPSRFTGKERDTESGNDYFGARYYASNMGRFMSPDPSQLAFANPANPQGFNLYSYAVNNPLKFVDPSGLWHCVWDSAAGDKDDKHEDGGASEGDCADQGGVWTIDEGDSEADPVATFQGESEHLNRGSALGAFCTALPSGGV